MKFKIDENLPVEVAALLNQAGHDASTVYEQGLVGVVDENIAQVCQTEGQIIVTLAEYEQGKIMQSMTIP